MKNKYIKIASIIEILLGLVMGGFGGFLLLILGSSPAFDIAFPAFIFGIPTILLSIFLIIFGINLWRFKKWAWLASVVALVISIPFLVLLRTFPASNNLYIWAIICLISLILGRRQIFPVRETTENSQKNKKQSGFTLPIVILIAVVLIAAGGAGYYFYKTLQEAEEAEALKERMPVEKILPAEAFIRDKVELDINQDGENETLVLYVLNKKIEKDESIWCGNISGEKLKGDFYLALIAQNLLQSQVKLFPYWFENGGDYKNKKLIAPQDLNGDGKKTEFAFDSYGSCNGNYREIIGYSLKEQKLKRFQFYKEGKTYEKIFVSELPGPGLEHKEGFLTQKFYSNAPPIGDHYLYFRWNLQEEKFDFVKEEIKTPEVKVPEEPYIKVLSPNGGEKWVAGRNYNVTWDSKAIDEVRIYVKWWNTSSGSGFVIAEKILADEGKFSLAIPSYFPHFNSYEICVEEQPEMLKISDKVSVIIEKDYASDCTDDFFSIVWENRPLPFLSILSPQEGSYLIAGQTYDITWQSQAVKKINILWTPYSAPPYYGPGGPPEPAEIARNFDALEGKYSWKVPFDLLGEYEISVVEIIEQPGRDPLKLFPLPRISDLIRINVVKE